MKNTIFFDSNFNFTLLENEENPANSIYIKFHTSDAANQVLNILANASTITENLASDTDIVYELEQTNWTNNGATVIWLSNDDISSPKVKIIFSEIPTASCAINRGTNTVFIMQYEGQAEEEPGGGSGGGSGSGGGFDFVETIRNIGFRLLDEPENVSIEYDEINNSVSINWTDPADIVTNEPAPAEWAGTVVVKKSGSAPLHKWDGTIIADSTTRDEYSVNALIDNNIDTSATYFYGIFPYDTKGDYRYTKVVTAYAAEIPAPQITSLSPAITSILVNYSVSNDFTWDHITLVYKKNSAPADKTDGTAVSLSASSSSIDITGLDEQTTYYFKIFAQVQGATEELESNTASTTTGASPLPNYRCLSSITVGGISYNLLQITDFTLIPDALVNEDTRIRSATLQSLSLNHPNFVTSDGDSFYHHTQETHNASRRDICNNNYMTLSCPSGLFVSAGIQVNGLIWDDNVSSSRISTWGTGAATVDSGYRDYYIGVIIDDVYERGFVIIMAHSHNFDSASLEGYQAYIYGGKVGDTDYIYETFKNA